MQGRGAALARTNKVTAAKTAIKKPGAKPIKGRRAHRAPTPAAQYFIDIAGPLFRFDARARDKALKAYLARHRVKWRGAGAFLKGAPSFAHPELLARFLEEKSGERFHPDQFTNTPNVPNFLAKFCEKNKTTRFLKAAAGKYFCFRVGFEELDRKPYQVSDGADRHTLEIMFHGALQAGTFKYVTANGDDVKGSWRGYALANATYAFLFGMCEKGEDASYFVLSQHPDYAGEILIGMQSLFLPNVKRAVSRHLVAVRQDVANAERLAAALNWLNAARKESVGLVIDLSVPVSAKN